MSGNEICFYIFSGLAILFSLFVVLGKNPIYSAFSLVMVFFCFAADYVLLQAHLIATLQVLVYAGAIMVLFVFVIMLLNTDTVQFDFGKSKVFQVITGILTVVLLTIFVNVIKQGGISTQVAGFTDEKIEKLGGNTQVLSELLFSDYILPFELTSILLLVGIIGTVALAKRKHEGETDK